MRKPSKGGFSASKIQYEHKNDKKLCDMGKSVGSMASNFDIRNTSYGVFF